MTAVLRLLRIVQFLADALIRLIGPLFVLLALGLTNAVIYVWWYGLLPLTLAGRSVLSPVGLAHCLIAALLIVNILFNYIWCIITPPGNPPKNQAFETANDDDSFCKKCNSEKPARAHHCFVCKRCILKMDHHCPWVHNCVGFFNHRYFVLFLLWMWSGCAYVALLSSSTFFEEEDWNSDWPYAIGRGSVVFVFVLTISIFVALTFMLGWQIFLVASGQTTVEFYFNRFRKKESALMGEVFVNEYDLGWRKNVDLFFGYHGQWWRILLPALSPPPGDGINFPKIVQSSASYLHV